MNGVEQNPYAASKAAATATQNQTGIARRVLLRGSQSLFLAVLFCLSFLFLGCSVKHGITSGWDYTQFFITEYPFLTAIIVFWNGLLRGILLPRYQLRTAWMPLVAGVASFLSFNWVHFRIEAIRQSLFPYNWGDGILELVIMGIAPSFVGILVEAAGHGVHLLLKRNNSKEVT